MLQYVQLSYDAAGREHLRHSRAGFIPAQGYTPTGMLQVQAAGRDSVQFRHLLGGDGSEMTGSVVNRRWAYDGAYNVRRIEDGLWGNAQYSCDQNDQITRVMPDGAGSAGERYEYDANLNIRAVLAAEQRISQQQQAGRVVSRGDCEYRYDAAGRLTEKRLCRDGWRPQRWRYRWNAHSQLSEFITPGGERWRYAYDPFGRRIRKEKRPDIATGTRPVGCEYQWSGDQLIAETPLYADGRAAYEESIHWLYAPGGLTPVARQEKGKLHYVVSDHMGTPRELLTKQGKRAWAGRLSLWGRGSQWAVAANDADKLSCNLRFAGQYEDEESGLHYNRFRYYDTETGQYLTPDPIGLLGGVNPYGYVSNPLKFIDPLGLVAVDTPGYNVYGLYDPGATEPYYVGITDNMDRRAIEHTKTGRLTPGASMRPLDEYVTYGQARGYEQYYIDKFGTKTGGEVNQCQRQTEGIKLTPLTYRELTREPRHLKMLITVKDAEYVHE